MTFGCGLGFVVELMEEIGKCEILCANCHRKLGPHRRPSRSSAYVEESVTAGALVEGTDRTIRGWQVGSSSHNCDAGSR